MYSPSPEELQNATARYDQAELAYTSFAETVQIPVSVQDEQTLVDLRNQRALAGFHLGTLKRAVDARKNATIAERLSQISIRANSGSSTNC